MKKYKNIYLFQRNIFGFEKFLIKFLNIGLAAESISDNVRDFTNIENFVLLCGNQAILEKVNNL